MVFSVIFNLPHKGLVAFSFGILFFGLHYCEPELLVVLFTINSTVVF